MDARGLRDWAVLAGACAAAAYVFALGHWWPWLRPWGQAVALAAVAAAGQYPPGRAQEGRHARAGLLTYALWLAVYGAVPAGGDWAVVGEVVSVLAAGWLLASYAGTLTVPRGCVLYGAIGAAFCLAAPAASAAPAHAPPAETVLRALLFASVWHLNAAWKGRTRGQAYGDIDAILQPVQACWILTTWRWAALVGGTGQAFALLFLVLRDAPRRAA